MSFRNDSTRVGSAQLPSLHPPGAEEASLLAAACVYHHQLPPVSSPFIYSAEQAGSSVKGRGGE